MMWMQCTRRQRDFLSDPHRRARPIGVTQPHRAQCSAIVRQSRLHTALLALGLAVGCGDSAVGGTEEPGSTSSAVSMTSTSSTSSTGAGVTAGDTTTASADSSGEPGTGTPTEGSASDGVTGVTDGGVTDGDSTGGDETTGEASDDTSTTAADTGTDEGGMEEPPIPGPKVKIMTFNIRVGTANDGPDAWDKRKGLVFQVFKDQDADFIGVQEAYNFQLTAIDAAVPAYKRIGVGTLDGKLKGPINAIYYRKSRFSVNNSNTFWLSDTPEKAGSKTWGNKFPRAVTWGRFTEKSSNYTLYVFNTHFDHVSQKSREKSAVMLSQRIADRGAPKDPFVVTGDLNAGEGNTAIKFLKGNVKIGGKDNEVPVRDSFRVLHPDASNAGTAHGFSGKTDGNKIDYVFVPPKQTVNGSSIDHFNKDGRYPSDHFPVVGTVTFADKP